MEDKLICLKNYLSKFNSIGIAFSGGLDSTLLLYLAVQVLGTDRVIAFTIDAPHIPRRDVARAKRIAKELGVEHVILNGLEILNYDEVRCSTPERCYLCKKVMYRLMTSKARELGIQIVVDGSNADDLTSSDRVGVRALKELGIESPLAICGLTRREVELLIDRYGYPLTLARRTTCLLTRFPPLKCVDLEELVRAEKAEEVLYRYLNFEPKVLRIRIHGDLIRIEIERENIVELAKIITSSSNCIDELKRLGFKYVTIDCEGYHGW